MLYFLFYDNVSEICGALTLIGSIASSISLTHIFCIVYLASIFQNYKFEGNLVKK